MARFEVGNKLSRGRPKGALKKVNARLAEACREVLESSFWRTVERLLCSREDRVRLETLKWLTERGYGRAPQTIRVGIDPGSPEAILLALAEQHIPGTAFRAALPALTELDAAAGEDVDPNVTPASHTNSRRQGLPSDFKEEVTK